MSLYIPGIPMPKTCRECQFLEGDDMDGLCHAANRWLDDEDFWTWYAYAEDDIDTSKPCNCPLIEVPPHGRLVDADALAKYVDGFRDESDHSRIMDYTRQEIIDCFAYVIEEESETIIPADGADKEEP